MADTLPVVAETQAVGETPARPAAPEAEGVAASHIDLLSAFDALISTEPTGPDAARGGSAAAPAVRPLVGAASRAESRASVVSVAAETVAAPSESTLSPVTPPVIGSSDDETRPSRRSSRRAAETVSVASALDSRAGSAQAHHGAGASHDAMGASRPVTPPASRAPHRGGFSRRVAAKGMAALAMSFVALMAVATSIPANALLSTTDVQVAARAAQAPKRTEPGQSIQAASGSDSITVQRDGYESATIAEAAAASGIRLEATFTNNPNGTIQWPFAVGVHIGDRFGYRDCAGCSSNHGGQDFNPGEGAPIQSIADGIVRVAEDGEGSLGVNMMIDHMIDGKLVTSVYAHMQHGSMRFKVGDQVKVGQVVGNTGNTGMSTGPHLHFEIRLGGVAGTKVDPLEWLYANTN
ncbi:peptidoglycan DD-metalloendopeptidase family protein [Luethyella okanaganae]|uniref:Peptidoglycan DD-metalloendopeptidase family protein n=1 Tax=Luethyella okanaganae TaxID=69372 RepID=A0ABW1VCM8_9MICO